jgi:hypothetical protein
MLVLHHDGGTNRGAKRIGILLHACCIEIRTESMVRTSCVRARVCVRWGGGGGGRRVFLGFENSPRTQK